MGSYQGLIRIFVTASLLSASDIIVMKSIERWNKKIMGEKKKETTTKRVLIIHLTSLKK